jgi:hypothetical protein
MESKGIEPSTSALRTDISESSYRLRTLGFFRVKRNSTLVCERLQSSFCVCKEMWNSADCRCDVRNVPHGDDVLGVEVLSRDHAAGRTGPVIAFPLPGASLGAFGGGPLAFGQLRGIPGSLA